MSPYASARARAQLVDALLAAQLALWTLRLVGALWTDASPDGALALMFARGARVSGPFLLLLFACTALALLAWLARCSQNTPALGRYPRLSTWQLGAALLLPLFQLVTVPLAVRYVWRATDPTPPRRRWLLATWWGALGVAVLTRPTSAISAAMMIVSAVSLMAIVRDAQRRQDEQYNDDVLRSGLPLPTGEALR